MNEYLVHYGIKGQKWGVRRYQNPDGTYTVAGKKRLKGDNKPDKTNTVKLSTEQKTKMIDDINKYKRNVDKIASENKDVNDMYNSDSIKKARTKMEELKRIKDGFENDEDTFYDYNIKMLSIYEGESEADLRQQYSKWDFGGWDSTAYGAFNLYLKDKGSSLKEFDIESDRAIKQYESECKKAVDNLLGEFGDQKISEYYGRESNVKSIVTDALVELAQEETTLWPDLDIWNY